MILSARWSHGALESCDHVAIYLLKCLNIDTHERTWPCTLVVKVIEKAWHCISAGQKNCKLTCPLSMHIVVRNKHLLDRQMDRK